MSVPPGPGTTNHHGGWRVQVRFECVEQGLRLFSVIHIDGVTAMFTGTAAECGRFEVVYLERKDYHAREEALRTGYKRDERRLKRAQIVPMRARVRVRA